LRRRAPLPALPRRPLPTSWGEVVREPRTKDGSRGARLSGDHERRRAREGRGCQGTTNDRRLRGPSTGKRPRRISQPFALAPRSGERVRERGLRSFATSAFPGVAEVIREGPRSFATSAFPGVAEAVRRPRTTVDSRGPAIAEAAPPHQPTVCPRPAQRGEGKGEGSAILCDSRFSATDSCRPATSPAGRRAGRPTSSRCGA